MSGRELWAHLLRGFGMGGAIFAGILAIVLYSGQTFGQRCAAAFPNNLAEQERCAYEMAEGLRDYPTQQRRDPNQ